MTKQRNTYLSVLKENRDLSYKHVKQTAIGPRFSWTWCIAISEDDKGVPIRREENESIDEELTKLYLAPITDKIQILS